MNRNRNPYLIRLLKYLIRYSKKGDYKINLSVCDRSEIADNNLGKVSKGTLDRFFSAGKKAVGSFDDHTLNFLVGLVNKEFNFHSWNDFVRKETDEWARDLPNKSYNNLTNTLRLRVDSNAQKRILKLIEDQSKNDGRSIYLMNFKWEHNNRYNSIKLLSKTIILIKNLNDLKENPNNSNFSPTYDSNFRNKKVIATQYEVNQNLDYLEELLTLKPEQTITPELIELFTRFYHHDWEDTNSLKRAIKLDKLVAIILAYINSDDSEMALRLRLASLSLNWTLGRENQAKKNFDRAYRQVEILDSNNLSNKLSLQEYRKIVFEYGCGFDLALLPKYRDFAENYEGSKDNIKDINVVAIQCSICRLLRTDKLSEAKYWLERMEEEIESHYNNSTVYIPKKSYRLLYYYFYKGILFI